MSLDLAKVGILALGSHEERHGAALPPDTDARLASHVALEAAKRTGAKFLGTLYSSYELPHIDTGRHQTLEEVMEELRVKLKTAKQTLGIESVVLVNAHGGNKPLRDLTQELEQETSLRVSFNNKIIELEGPHAATNELSMGAVIGITDVSKIAEHSDFELYPEVGFVGLKEARKCYPWAERQAQEVERIGVLVDKFLGEKLLECAIIDVMNDIRKLGTLSLRD
ncbi:MAG: 2-amino-5-formylamino-6-ribosylaminopyrimidin-4(3H)-one 5'-monophosphate deformylase [Candidatus Hadarchaeaceae archaeon]